MKNEEKVRLKNEEGRMKNEELEHRHFHDDYNKL